jgi:signal transduction histidine kinase/CheY-like chemotaxis protein
VKRSKRIGLLAGGGGLIAAGAMGWWFLSSRPDYGRTYTVGFENDPPFQVVLADGRASGLAVEAVREAAARAGIRLRWMHTPDGSERALRERKVDLWPLMVVLPQRRSVLHLTAPWLDGSTCLLVRRASDIWQPKDAIGKRIAIVGQALRRQQVASRWRPSEFVMVQTPLDVLRAVCTSRADAGHMDEQAALLALLESGECAGGPLRIVGIPAITTKMALGSTFEAAPAADAIRTEIGRLANEGRLEAIMRDWAYFVPGRIKSISDLVEARRDAIRLGAVAAVATLLLLAALWQSLRLRQARRAAEEASASKSGFLATVSHEIRTPMSGVIGLADMLTDTALTGKQAELVASIGQCARSLLEIVDDVLDLSRVEAGRLELERVPFSPRDPLRDVLRVLNVRAAEKGIELRAEVEDDLPGRVLGDPLRVRQVLFNLVGNALKFTERGIVTVRSGVDRRIGHRVEIWYEVRDTGKGIAPQSLRALFEPYFQESRSAAREHGGFGLGLPISKWLVEAMGGSITVTSKPGSGSTSVFAAFDVDTSPPPPEPVAGPAGVPRPLRPLRVLVAEDNPVNQRVTRHLLEKLGHEIHLAANGAEAIQAWREREFDAILMDCQMPEMDGFEATRRIREAEAGNGARHTPIIAMTANAMAGDREACLAAGMEDHLAKPVNLQALDEALRRCVPAG